MDLKIYSRKGKNKVNFDISFLNHEVAQNIHDYHNSYPMYKETPLVDLKEQAKLLGVSKILVKDESYRFGLNAFKVLGGSYAVGKVVADRLGIALEDLPYEKLISREVKEKLGELTFVTATDGNHGRGVAWAANKLQQKSKVFMPRGAAQERVDNIAKEGAEVTVFDGNYDEAVRYANDLAEKNGYIMVQDTAWEGYEDIPRWIMQGYMTLAWEMYTSMEDMKVKPTHVFLQAGVGSFAAAATGFLVNMYGKDNLDITIVEPSTVACIYESAIENKRVLVGGDHKTIMAGLACGEPNTVGLKVLLDYATHFISASDEFAAHGMRVLGNPLGEDKKVISGESGAAAFGAISKVLSNEEYKDIKEELGLNEDSVLLFVSTEGDTDKQNYKDIVWDGKYQSL
ncbi:MAG: diaminopropionate ammonia-lyase [Tissierellia bacterium]|nr:diaminopropionate ammonia-lyase [Tissierellia bacterium]